MRRRRTGESHGDTAAGLGAAVDELMRHQPSLRIQAMQDIVKVCASIPHFLHDALLFLLHQDFFILKNWREKNGKKQTLKNEVFRIFIISKILSNPFAWKSKSPGFFVIQRLFFSRKNLELWKTEGFLSFLKSSPIHLLGKQVPWFFVIQRLFFSRKNLELWKSEGNLSFLKILSNPFAWKSKSPGFLLFKGCFSQEKILNSEKLRDFYHF